VSPPAAVLFDNDGLLLDTETIWTRAEGILFERRNLEFTADNKRELIGASAERAGAILAERLGEPGRENELIAVELVTDALSATALRSCSCPGG
jgi:beta-phosphoglucomutase-like phosphatase (HAD superfamily)